MRHPGLLGFLLTVSVGAAAQVAYTPGESYYSPNGYIEYIAGNMPLVISAPHGGALQPASIPDRNCGGCVYTNDAFTEELSRAVFSGIHDRTGCYPHLIINHLHRRKLDANRAVAEAADGNLDAAQAWGYFHQFISTARSRVSVDFGKGLYVDLHGHGHAIQRLELGYLLYEDELQLGDAVLNSPTYIAYSSLRHLTGDNPGNHPHAALLRGAVSLGHLLGETGHPAVPSPQDPFPLPGEPYFEGGYNTARHSSVDGGTVDGVQIECHQSVRFDPLAREAFAEDLAAGLSDFLAIHYLPPPAAFCLATASPEPPGKAFSTAVHPNPACGPVYVAAVPHALDFLLFDATGRLLRSEPLPADGMTVDLGSLPAGLYTWVVRTRSAQALSGTLAKTCAAGRY
jgi:hypothetical protein